jgi:DNA-binding transcriptional MerR regulator
MASRASAAAKTGLEPAATAGSSVAGVIGTNDTGRRWSIGELARASGLTVRALRHYDEIGLLRASERTASGHRRYTEPDLRRLYRVRALRALGLSLKEIAGVLAGTADDLGTMRGLLAGQLHRLEEHEQQIQRLKAAAQRMWQDNSADLGQRLPWPADQMTGLVAYLHRARQAG